MWRPCIFPFPLPSLQSRGPLQFYNDGNFPENLYPPNLGGGVHPPNLGGESSKNTCFTVLSGAHSPNLGGKIFTPQIWGVWVFRVLPWLIQSLEAGVAVVCERHVWSGVVFFRGLRFGGFRFEPNRTSRLHRAIWATKTPGFHWRHMLIVAFLGVVCTLRGSIHATGSHANLHLRIKFVF